jgi:hypothetical protein
VTVASYLLELHLPRGVSLSSAAEAAGRVEAASVPGGGRVRYVRTLFVAEDETCFHFFEAPCLDAVAEAASRAGLVAARVTEAVPNEEATTTTHRRIR